MFHIAETEYDFIEGTLLDYDIGGYIIGHESEPYSHYHIMFQGSDSIYNTFSKRLVEKYNLRGKAGKDACRQYGRLSKIKDLEKMKSYTLKDGNVRSNLESCELTKLIEQSFKKQTHQNLVDKIVEYINDLPNIHQDTYLEKSIDRIRYVTIKYCIDNNIKLNRSLIKNVQIQAICKMPGMSINLKTSKINSIL